MLPAPASSCPNGLNFALFDSLMFIDASLLGTSFSTRRLW